MNSTRNQPSKEPDRAGETQMYILHTLSQCDSETRETDKVCLGPCSLEETNVGIAVQVSALKRNL